MFIIITKRYFKLIMLAGLAVLLIFLYKSLDFWMYHRYMPWPDSSSYDWNYKSIFTSFKPAKKGYSVHVDLDHLLLTLYKEAERINSWPVSGGSKDTPSPTGSWIVTEVDDWGSSFGGSWIALNVPWGKYGIHGTIEPWVVGNRNISHGCIRMKNSDVAELKKYMIKGVPIYIKYDNIPFRELMDGKVGSDVIKLQVMLKQLDYYDETPDGRFGQSTFNALCKFQAIEQIKVDGVVGLESWKLLQERVANQKIRFFD